MAFRYSGVNWAGREWQVVPSIKVLGIQVEDVRDGTYITDGTVASRGHDIVNPGSHHSPDDDGNVRAIDIGGPTDFLDELAENLRASRDPRIVYVIYNGRIFSNYELNGIAPFTWRTYIGSNKHVSHIHVSVRRDLPGDDEPWDIGFEEVEVPPVSAPLTPAEEAAIENLLNEGIFTEYTVDNDPPGELDSPVPLRRLSVFLDRIMQRVVAVETEVAHLEKDGECQVELWVNGERIA